MKLLIVEDEQRLGESLKQGLQAKGYAVDHLMDGIEAKRRILLYRDEYDLIILDLMLPGLSGEEVCREVRKEQVTTPILILSAKTATDDKVGLLNSGADDYLAKPFTFNELEARIAALLRRPQTALPLELLSPGGNIRLNTRNHTVTVHDAAINLTLKEFMMLEYFLRHPNAVITRDELLEHGWDFNFAAFSNIVDVHVKNLRKKLEAAGTEAHIETVRGVGYRFVG